MTKYDKNSAFLDNVPTRSNRIQRNLRSVPKKNASVVPRQKTTNEYTPKIIFVPASELLKKWREPGAYELETSTFESKEKAKETMRKLDFRMKQLRSCFTVQSLQKASVHVAAALIDIAGLIDCHNPFLCLHQAAMFAGQGSKGGNSDAPFKSLLPPKSTCTELEALITLGRSDCMRALGFIDQAMFLCSFVAQVCRIHRDEGKPEYRWNNRWVVIGIQMYTTSMAIDRTIEMNPEMSVKQTPLLDWDYDVKAEIERCKSDAGSVLKACSVKVRPDNVDFVSSIKSTSNSVEKSSLQPKDTNNNGTTEGQSSVELNEGASDMNSTKFPETYNSEEDFSSKKLFPSQENNMVCDDSDEDDAISISVVAV